MITRQMPTKASDERVKVVKDLKVSGRRKVITGVNHINLLQNSYT